MSTQHTWDDVVHCYQFSGIEMSNATNGFKATFDSVTRFQETKFVRVISDGKRYTRRIGEYKPILRDLRDMTEGERKELWRVVFSTKTTNRGRISPGELEFHGKCEFIKSSGSMSFDRWVMTQGLQRMGIQMNDVIWADYDLHNIDHNSHIVTVWLISRGFDIFGLIESGQAIRKEQQS